MADLRRVGSTILRQGSVLSKHSANCCCESCATCPETGGNGCGECTDTIFDSDKDAKTPTDFTVTFSGVTMRTTCCDYASGPPLSAKIKSGVLDGTWTLTHGVRSACEWYYSEVAGFTIDASEYAGAGCTSTETAITLFEIILTRGSGQWELFARIVCATEFDLFYDLIAETSGNDCCESHEFANDEPAFDCGTGTASTDNLGTGGTATITPCS